jgi:MYXO-CTERM domain-containing protein
MVDAMIKDKGVDPTKVLSTGASSGKDLALFLFAALGLVLRRRGKKNG